MLIGRVRFTVGHDDYDAEAGTWVMVPPGAPHTFANVGDDTAVMLNTFTPDLYVQYFRDLKAMVESGQPLTRSSLLAHLVRGRRSVATPADLPRLDGIVISHAHYDHCDLGALASY